MAVLDYRTRDGLADYGFSIEFEPNAGWRAYIVFQPFYGGHDGSLKLPYESTDGRGRRYVNWSPKLDSLGDAKTVAALWAELIHRHQHTPAQRRVTSTGEKPVSDTVRASGEGRGDQSSESDPPHAA
ncbi:MAG: hypothetical protein M3228_15570 [Actinomycetota bacterium]|nr:hypothetical protein [Actinomycetota bacterium]